ncbi:MAG: stage V sporulation protein AD [Syntrophomonadaceae bacterium]|nr:stage V sporulation protein AD [Syntrophomonadaceae bacterium]
MPTSKKKGTQTVVFARPPGISSWASIVGPKEGAGPWGSYFDWRLNDYLFGEETWEKAESKLLRETVKLAISKGNYQESDMELLIAGDLLNQTIASNFAARDLALPLLGIFGACSTIAEGLIIGAMLIDGDCIQRLVAAASSHHYTAERQFRLPTEQGTQKPPTAQWTATAAGAAVLDGLAAAGPRITAVTIGRVVDMGITDAADMGSAMAPAAVDSIKRHLRDMGRPLSYYDLVVTGDLGRIGKTMAEKLLSHEGIEPYSNYKDCGVSLFGLKQSGVNAGASGCGCSASMLCGPLLKKITDGDIHKLLFVATGALMSPLSSWQGESIPGIAHAVAIEY